LTLGCEVERPKRSLNLDSVNMAIESSLALDEADKVYAEAKDRGLDFSQGPCLSNNLFGNPDYPETLWVLDIAHQPREEVDNQKENQCLAYREGRALNYIEFDEEGNLIRLYSPLLNQQRQREQSN